MAVSARLIVSEVRKTDTVPYREMFILARVTQMVSNSDAVQQMIHSVRAVCVKVALLPRRGTGIVSNNDASQSMLRVSDRVQSFR